MAKIIILGEQTPPKDVKKIEFAQALDGQHNLVRAEKFGKPAEWEHIELICRNYAGRDLMFAYNSPTRRDCGVFFIGKFNDGIV